MDQFKLVLPHTTQVLWQNIHKIRKQKKCTAAQNAHANPLKTTKPNTKEKDGN